VKLADAVNISYPDNYFDFVFSSEVIEHVEDYLLMLKEINRILKPNGVLVLTTTCYSTSIFQFLNLYRGSISKFFKELSIYFTGFVSKRRRDFFVRKWCFQSLGGHYHGFRPRALKRDINSVGMTVLKKEPFYVYPPVIIYDPKSIYRLAVSGKTNYQIIKRIIMLFLSLIISISNPVFRFFGLLSNNILIVAKKGVI
jgi:SAM-dependent methyltransferase